MIDIPAERQSDVPATTNGALPDNAVLIDVREDDEWARGRAPHAVHIPLGQLTERLGDLPENRPLVVTCRGGGRSSRAVAYLRDNGYDVLNLEGGMMAWARDGRPMTHDGPGIPEVR